MPRNERKGQQRNVDIYFYADGKACIRQSGLGSCILHLIYMCAYRQSSTAMHGCHFDVRKLNKNITAHLVTILKVCIPLIQASNMPKHINGGGIKIKLV
jgi:hypothetical protein